MTGESVAVAREWLVEHLQFAVPMHMADIDARARRKSPIPPARPITYAERVENMCRDATGLDVSAGQHNPGSRTVAALIATQGDTLFGSSKRGRAAALSTALSIGLAGTALLHEDGANGFGLHWCARNPCPHREPPPDTPRSDPVSMADVHAHLDNLMELL